MLRRSASLNQLHRVKGKSTAQLQMLLIRQIDRSYDPKEGGFGTAPKFPRPVTLNFLTRFYAREVGHASGSPQDESAVADLPRTDKSGTHALPSKALDMALFTLRKMAAGGMHDHIGGGFHRYSVDRYWHVPHFEKMLYDQAQLAVAYLDAFQITKDKQYESVARDILDYVARDMTSKEGGFFSAEDADSPVVAGIDDPGYRRPPKAHSMFGRKKRSMMRSEIRPRFSISITAFKRTATPRKEAIRTMNSAGKTF